MTAKDLKNALLQEAVQGKLVPQIASEGNARDLLAEIRKAKDSKCKIGGPISENEIPFDIPESWCWCRGSELFNIRSASRIHQSDWKSSGVPFLRGRELVQLARDGELLNPEIFISEDFYNDLVKKSGIPHENDILVSAVGTLGRCYIVKKTDKFYYKDAYILCYENVNNLYAPFYKLIIETPYYQEKIREDSQATTVAQFTIIKAKTIPFPLPPLSEQKRIVAAIEKFMPLIEEYGKKETVLNQLNTEIGTLTTKAILQEAVQGKLVPQDSSEGNAKELLKEIKAKKEALIKSGKIKKEKPLPEITEDEIPFDIPENWCWCRLGEVFELVTGSTPSKSNLNYYGSEIPFYKPADLDIGMNIRKAHDYLSVLGFEKSRKLPKQSVLVCCIGSIGKTGLISIEGACNQQINAIIANSSFEMKYIYYLMNSTLVQSELSENASMTTLPILNKAMFALTIIPFPPLSEQKRIVSAIEQLLPLCEKLGKE